MKNSSFTALVLAGSRQAIDPVARYAGVSCKALAPIGGRPLLANVIDALRTAERVGGIWVVGEGERDDSEVAHWLGRAYPDAIWRRGATSPSASVGAALPLMGTDAVLVTTADHALLTAKVIDYFAAAATASEDDLSIGLAPAALVEQALPGQRRTEIRFRDRAYCGCNLFGFMRPAALAGVTAWQRVEQQRKHPWRLMGLLGLSYSIRYRLGWLPSAEAVRRLSRVAGCRVGLVELPFGEAAFDVDTPADLEYCRRRLEAKPP